MSDAPIYAIGNPVAMILFAGAFVILGFNVALIIQNRILKREMAAPPAILPQSGATIYGLEGAAWNGVKAKVLF